MPFDEEDLGPHGECAAEIARLKQAAEYMLGALQIVVSKSSDAEMRAVAQAALDLAEHGEEACAAMRGETV